MVIVFGAGSGPMKVVVAAAAGGAIGGMDACGVDACAVDVGAAERDSPLAKELNAAAAF